MSGCFFVLGVRIDALQIPGVIEQMHDWVLAWRAGRDRACRYINVTNVQSVTEPRRDSSFQAVLDNAALCVPDGMPLVWLGRHRGYDLRRRVYGPDLMVEFCSRPETRGCTHFFFGGAEGMAENLARKFSSRFPGLRVAGTYAPPFRALSSQEDEECVAAINRAAPDILWVCLGCPKQERWMYEHRDRLAVPVVVGVGQAFDIHAGNLRQAPAWMREHGLEWLFRLCLEPRRLWRRYLFSNTQFLFYLALESLGLKTFPAPPLARSTRSGL
jgi:N-acetylglucosaminyldiphosphoundecaprenol N-acetyl-beta-D-mannosaminyltransferase